MLLHPGRDVLLSLVTVVDCTQSEGSKTRRDTNSGFAVSPFPPLTQAAIVHSNADDPDDDARRPRTS